ncbi:Tetratricopeptide TPR_2 repeat protein [Magnetococcus marinus MC-1]|uniref:Tetratricopeptide TPR_2 repeat protein n=1 Tax=Magnetococcus marinus (strain ATCC BAA-1437 / JCM 17883 / MC-1) TaxID=156889 RepID=A0L546_MAGMM|nr:tetratricopeptide repeat protein [Magnetococcus marinus]ABK43089.1 Tetratricopeptide TPR_2 repeat protein [Magnetococcus marinus MC-1]
MAAVDTIRESLEKAITLQQQGHAEEALLLYHALLQHYPKQADLYYLTGLAHQDLQQWPQACERLEQAVALDGQRSDFLLALGMVLQELELPEQAKQRYAQAALLDPQDYQAYYHIGDSCIDLGQNRQAIEAFTQAIKCKPDLQEAWLNLGLCLKAAGELPGALQAFTTALQLNPDDAKAKVDYAMALLAMGDYANGWRYYTARFQFSHVFNDMQRIPANVEAWNGEPLQDKTLLVLCEQGYGDNLQFARYLPMLRARGVKKLIVESKGHLIELFRYNELADAYCNVMEVKEQQADYYVPLLELPRLLETRVENIPADLPLYRVSAALMHKLAAQIPSGGFKVGLVWSGKPLHPRDPARRRSCPFAELAPLATVAGVDFYSLQTGLEEDHMPSKLAGDTPLIDLNPYLDDFHHTAAAMQQLDLIITIDTAAAHLAGSLKRPTWLLTPYAADWRWGVTGNSTPWYPGMRLYRQPAPGAWQPVIAQVTAQLRQLVAYSTGYAATAPSL